LIVDDRDTVLAEAGNAFGWPDGDATGHAELIAVREASQRFPPARLAQATLSSSAEPCAMCAGAVYWAGLRRVVYALSEARLRTLTGDHPENPTLALPCREVFARGQRAIVVVGPCWRTRRPPPTSASGGSWAGPYRRLGVGAFSRYQDCPYRADHLPREGSLAYGLLRPMRPLQPLPEERVVSLHPIGNGRRRPGSHPGHPDWHRAPGATLTVCTAVRGRTLSPQAQELSVALAGAEAVQGVDLTRQRAAGEILVFLG
jgi:tRNA(Arg) A34 adenosine deaminase TadA